MGKCYGDDEFGVEILCTKFGVGLFSIGDALLFEKGAKVLFFFD